MSDLELVSAIDTIDLTALLTQEYGALALKGLGGFGLPDKSVQTSRGAGNGVTYRGTRALERTIDIPLALLESNRIALQALFSRFAVLLAEPSVLRFTDGSAAVWTLDVWHTGGGGHVYGSDTLGTDWLKTVITLQAGQPFWRRVTAQTQALAKPFGAVSITPLTLMRTNSVPNPRLGVNADGWSGGGGSVTRVAQGAGWAVQTVGSVSSYLRAPEAVGAAGQFWAGSVVVSGPVGRTVRARIHDGAGYITPDNSITLTGAPQTIAVTSSAAAAGTAPRIYIYPTVTGGAWTAGQMLTATDALIEQVSGVGVSAGDYFDGATADSELNTYAWVGAVNASASTHSVPDIAPGDAPAPAVWTVTGPGINLRLTSPKGELLPWNGVLDVGQSLTIDTEARTIVDNLGRNRYGELGTAPRFPDLPAGTSLWQVAFDSTSADFALAFGLETYNFITNPRFPNLTGWAKVDTTLWTTFSPVYTSSSVGSNKLVSGIIGGGMLSEHRMTITGLTVGEEYRFGVTSQWLKDPAGWGPKTNPHLGQYIRAGAKKVSASRSQIGAIVPLTGTFIAESTSIELALGAGSNHNWQSKSATYFWEPYFTDDAGGENFTGATTDTAAAVYAWEAAADLSRSVKTIPAAPSNATTAIALAWNPRRWALI